MEKENVKKGIVFYSIELKHKICQEHIDKGTSLQELKRKYQLSSHSLIHDWLRKYEYLPSKFPQIKREKIYLGVENFTTIEMPIPISDNKISPLDSESKKINSATESELRKQLEDANIMLEGYKRMIEIAENDLKIPIRKKYNTK